MRKVHGGPESGADGSDYTIEGELRPRKTSTEKIAAAMNSEREMPIT